MNDVLLNNSHSLFLGGSPANVVFTGSSLGLRGAVCGSVGRDELGTMYSAMFSANDVDTYLRTNDGDTGVCYCLISSDGERTFLVDIGCSAEFDVHDDICSNAKIFHTSGYELGDNPDVVLKSAGLVKEFGGLISFDLASYRAVSENKGNVNSMLDLTDILFASYEEGEGVFGSSSRGEIKEGLKGLDKIVALKDGKNGSVVLSGGKEWEIPVYPAQTLVNTNGAGDSYAAGFLNGFVKGLPLCGCGEMGSLIASKVCSVERANLGKRNV